MTTKRVFKRPPLAQVEIVNREDKTNDLTLVWIEKPQDYTFKPGQYCTIGHQGVERAYSIASAPHEEYIELFIELVPINEGGVLTPILWGLGEGDRVTIRPRAKGIFTFKEDKKDQLLVATVTGVVPYVSFVRDYIASGRRERPDLVTFVPTVSRPDEEKNSTWTGEKGRVNNIVEDKIKEFDLSTENTMIYACGHPGMIEDVKERVTPLGFEFLEERFWKED